ncbi:MAG: L-seryl-tRNA(Sec) selenium transferase [Acidimicrobiales bacterium]|nr:L-seryl-tRNA(Sec) selenium transferase [Acidimicrobiales bacterium]
MGKKPPSVNNLALSLQNSGIPHELLVEQARSAIAAGDWENIEERVEHLQRSFIQPVVNATGVLLHTNLGRASWESPESNFSSNIEFDLASGNRGSRQTGIGNLFAQLCGAESAMVVNNCSSAVLLVLSALASGKGVAISRSELVEIGGSFRVPEILELSGANLVEVGTTNKTRLVDYQKAIDAHRDVAMSLKVHQSNYKIVGFTEEATVEELTSLDLPLVVDIGSGLLDSSCPWLSSGPPKWLAGEPAAKQTLLGGADLVTFSCDKLLGGPQAGIIAGKSDLIEKCLRHPFARVLRPGSHTLLSLQELAMRYLHRDGDGIPFWKMASLGLEELRIRAERMNAGEIVSVDSIPGGGTLPTVVIPSIGLKFSGDRSSELRRGFNGGLPIIARVSDGDTYLDFRTVDPAHDEMIANALGNLD